MACPVFARICRSSTESCGSGGAARRRVRPLRCAAFGKQTPSSGEAVPMFTLVNFGLSP